MPIEIVIVATAAIAAIFVGAIFKVDLYSWSLEVVYTDGTIAHSKLHSWEDCDSLANVLLAGKTNSPANRATCSGKFVITKEMPYEQQ